MSEWQPIETAPKDGTEIIVWDGGRADMVRWQDYEFQNSGASWCMARGDTAHEGYVGYYGVHMVENPTHWMPLPDAPK